MPERLNPWMPEGIRALACWEPVRPVRDLALLEAEVTLCYDRGTPPGCGRELLQVLGQEQLVIQKRTKRKALADVDIRPMLRELALLEEGERRVVLRALVQAQNPGLNPALLAAAAETYLPILQPDFVQVRRLALLDGERKEFH